MAKRVLQRHRRKVRTVKVDIMGQVSLMDEEATCDPSVTALVLPQLEYDLTECEEGGPRGYRERQGQLCLHGLHLERRGAFCTGLVPRIVRVLTDQGYKVEITDYRDYSTERFQVDKAYFRQLHGEDRRLAKAVRREPCGQIEVKGFADLILAMRLIIYLYPKAKVLIPVATKEMARKIHVKLDTAVTDFLVWTIGRTWPNSPRRCAACTFQSLVTCPTEDYDIILLPEAVRSTSDTAVKGLALFHGPYDRKVWRVYSFSQAGLRLGRRERLRLEAISGEVIYRRAPEDAGVRVLWQTTPSGATISGGATALAFKRWAYWRNDRRNDFIAGVARAFMQQKHEKLRKYGVPFEGHEPVLRYLPSTLVVILVANTEQAQELRKRLPDWEVQSDVPGSSKRNDRPEGAEYCGTIITEARAVKSGLDADVLIRAGGSCGRLCRKGLPPRLEAKERRDVLIIDFLDDFDPRAAMDAKRRAREYESLGWKMESAPGSKGTTVGS